MKITRAAVLGFAVGSKKKYEKQQFSSLIFFPESKNLPATKSNNKIKMLMHSRIEMMLFFAYSYVFFIIFTVVAHVTE